MWRLCALPCLLVMALRWRALWTLFPLVFVALWRRAWVCRVSLLRVGGVLRVRRCVCGDVRRPLKWVKKNAGLANSLCEGWRVRLFATNGEWRLLAPARSCAR